MTASVLRNFEAMPKARRSAMGTEPTALTDIYEEEVNIAVWQRQLSKDLAPVVDQLVTANPELQLSINASPREMPGHLFKFVGNSNTEISKMSLLVEDMANTINMFCCLFDLQRVGLRLTALNKAMCPRFHVDRVPARLITTYTGVATEWLPHQCVNRRMLGSGSKGLADDVSGLYLLDEDIQQLNTGDVAILKGELWEGNEDAGLVHRSPAVEAGERRLLMTLDFVANTLQ